MQFNDGIGATLTTKNAPTLRTADLDRLYVFCCLRYPGSCSRLWALPFAALLFLHGLIIGRRLHFSGGILFRDHRNGVIASTVIRDELRCSRHVRGGRFATRSVVRAFRAVCRQRRSTEIGWRGLQNFMFAIGQLVALEQAGDSMAEDWRSTLLPADMSPATQVTGLYSDEMRRPVSVVHFTRGPSWSLGPNALLFSASSRFRFADTDVRSDRPVRIPETLCFEEAGFIANRAAGSRLRVVILTSGEARLFPLVQLVLRLLVARRDVTVTLRPHPRRMLGARILTVLPHVRMQDSRRSSVESSLVVADVAFGSVVGTVPRSLMVFRGDAHLILALDRAGEVARSHVFLDDALRASLTQEIHRSVPRRRQLRVLLENPSRAVTSSRIKSAFAPTPWELHLGRSFVPRADHLECLQAGKPPAHGPAGAEAHGSAAR